jgi:hypothetical protein
MPATTGVAAVPASRPGVELQAAFVPGYYLSSAVQKEGKGASISQASLLFEPSRWFGLPGLVLGARAVGGRDTGAYGEPMIGYRTHLDSQKSLSLGAIGYGTVASGENSGASYSAVRGGIEGLFDFRATPESQIFEVHLFSGMSLTGVDVDGEYCLDANGVYGVDCGNPAMNKISATARGAYPALSGGIGLDFARGIPSVFHGVRAAFQVAGGTMPTVTAAQQANPRTYGALGLSLTLGLGARD